MDTPYQHIACFIDDSEASRLALVEARRLRSLTPGRLSVVHVSQWPPPSIDGLGVWLPNADVLLEEARDWLTTQTAEVPGAEAVLLEGCPPVAACAWAEEAAVDLIVTACQRRPPGLTTLGSFAQHLAHHAPCPVVLVRPTSRRQPPPTTRAELLRQPAARA